MALRRFLAGKVPTEAVFLRHLLGFVMRRAASEASHAGLAGNDLKNFHGCKMECAENQQLAF